MIQVKDKIDLIMKNKTQILEILPKSKQSVSTKQIHKLKLCIVNQLRKKNAKLIARNIEERKKLGF